MANNTKKSIRYPENRKVKDQLKYGDAVLIAAKTSKTLNYVHEVLRGEKNSKEIIEAGKELIDMRTKFMEV